MKERDFILEARFKVWAYLKALQFESVNPYERQRAKRALKVWSRKNKKELRWKRK